ncbi:hypothetical protein BB561_004696 [Smittium simulii]|uniref:Uncharacterized protein n=1 Tax=Smittium simulii TaxID=133385 RepID=A0A2T9YET1_9FUNG|nr:hypothetical protein BB561_004696 [Smittium simulii]
MDTNWCFYCGNHIEHSDSDLYCSEKCRASDTLKEAHSTSQYQFNYVTQNKNRNSIPTFNLLSRTTSKSSYSSVSRTPTGYSIPSSPVGSLCESSTSPYRNNTSEMAGFNFGNNTAMVSDFYRSSHFTSKVGFSKKVSMS